MKYFFLAGKGSFIFSQPTDIKTAAALPGDF